MSTIRKHCAFSALLAGLMALGVSSAGAQPPDPAPAVRAAMAKLSWLEGEWLGEGWRAGPEGKSTYNASEVAEYDVDGTVLVLHGRGWSIGPDGEEIVGHNALGILSYDAMTQQYRMSAYVTQGFQTHGTPTVGDKEFRWSVAAGPNTEMRYHAWLSEDGEWTETGERCVGDNCVQFMGMKLKKTGD